MNTAAIIYPIHLATGIVQVIFGASQIGQPSGWMRYFPHWLQKILPLTPAWAMRIHGSSNILIGTLLISGVSVRFAAWIAAVWWAIITPLCWTGGWREGLRDVIIVTALASTVWLGYNKAVLKP